MRITEQELDERKKRIIYVAYELFCEYGIDAVSLSQIAKKSAVSIHAIYNYFNSKATLVLHTQKILWEEIMNCVLSDSQKKRAATKNGLEEMKILLFNFKRVYQENRRYLLFACDYKLFLVRHHIKNSNDFHSGFLMPVYRVFTATLERGQADGSIVKNEKVEAQFFAIWGIMRGFIEQIIIYGEISEKENPWEEQIDLVIKYILGGLQCY